MIDMHTRIGAHDITKPFEAGDNAIAVRWFIGNSVYDPRTYWVLVTVRSDSSAASTTTRTVLQNVQVLSTGTKMDADPNSKPENVSIVTLLVTPEESEKLALAENQGTIQFVLRNGGDAANAEIPAVGIAEMSGEFTLNFPWQRLAAQPTTAP